MSSSCTHWLTSASSYLWRSLAASARKVQALRERLKTIEDLRQARGIALLRQWLSPAQKTQFDASKCFDVIGCDSGRRYRISRGPGTNVHEIDDAGRPVTGWCFVPSGNLVAGDVMLAQKIALETNERAALAVANRYPVLIPRRTYSGAHPGRASGRSPGPLDTVIDFFNAGRDC
jgi:hypothetical protein